MTKKIILSLAAALLLIGVSAWAESPSVSPLPKTKGKTQAKIDVVCLSGAIEKRDVAVSSAFDKYASSVKMAITARTIALKTAWSSLDVKTSRKDRNAVWEMYRKSIRTAKRIMGQDKTAAWRQFKTEAKACHANGGDADEGGEGADAQL